MNTNNKKYVCRDGEGHKEGKDDILKNMKEE